MTCVTMAVEWYTRALNLVLHETIAPTCRQNRYNPLTMENCDLENIVDMKDLPKVRPKLGFQPLLMKGDSNFLKPPLKSTEVVGLRNRFRLPIAE
ncbi:hypothetical protein HW555_011331 [Spodoptera exigua]|uniref:Uncharacterized protein n=1 Tax=Spodoptera exigua TaxID=7107 RepID=A0A835G8R1_SPOEX|nr:hypothetical protein HW555_011331 [Spodoptera exigua]